MSHNEKPCVNQCGFYGNLEWNGYCSACRNSVGNNSGNKTHIINSNTKENQATMKIKSSNDKQESNVESRKVENTSNSLKPINNKEQHSKSDSQLNYGDRSIFNISANSISQVVQKFFTKPKTTFSPYKEFIRIITHPSSADVKNTITNFIEEMKIDLLLTTEEQSEKIIGFYTSGIEIIQTLVPYKNCSHEQIESLADCLERYIMNSLYDCVIYKISQPNGKDIEIYTKLKSLDWITFDHLSITSIDLNNGALNDLFNNAKENITKFITKPAPIDKLNHLIIASRYLLKLLKLNIHGKPPNADDFLPFLIYLLIQTCPSLLYTTITYINKFTYPNRLIRGEGAYYFTTLCVAVEFIENINYKSLSITLEEFCKNMGIDVDNDHNNININHCLLKDLSISSYSTVQSSINLLKNELYLMKNNHQKIENQVGNIIRSMDDLKEECKNQNLFLP